MSDRFIFDVVDTCAIDRETGEALGIKVAVERLNEYSNLLSNSISKDEVRGLVEKMEQDQHFAWSATLQSAIDDLNKLLTNKESGE